LAEGDRWPPSEDKKGGASRSQPATREGMMRFNKKFLLISLPAIFFLLSAGIG
jgi:hypothetical protein